MNFGTRITYQFNVFSQIKKFFLDQVNIFHPNSIDFSNFFVSECIQNRSFLEHPIKGIGVLLSIDFKMCTQLYLMNITFICFS